MEFDYDQLGKVKSTKYRITNIINNQELNPLVKTTEFVKAFVP